MSRIPRAALALGALAACGKSASMPHGDGLPGDGVPGDGNPMLPPGVGGHALAFFRNGGPHATTISTSAFTTAATGSTMIVGIGRGKAAVLDPAGRAPTDNKGNSPYQQLGSDERYTKYPDSSTASYAFPHMAGGAGHIVSTMVPSDDEITLAAVEVTGTTVQFQWNEQLSAPLQTGSVTTSGPATLVAFWWGDNGVDNRTAVANNGFVVIDSVLAAGELVECAVAVKHVDQAGTYDVTWTATPAQGAQLWLVSVE